MSKQTTLAPARVLIVIPDWGLAWYMFCLEHAVELSKSGKEVSVLDLSNLNPVLVTRRFWRSVLRISQKNRMIDIKEKILKDNQIKSIECKLSRQKGPTLTMTVERNEIFRAAIASKYAYITGRSDTQLDEVESKFVEMERHFFEFTLNLVTNILSEHDFSEVITVNGRYIVNGAVVQACKESQVKCSLIEAAGATPGFYEVYDVSPHDIPSVQKVQKEFWDKAGPERKVIAEKGLQKKVSGQDALGFDFRANFVEEFSQTVFNDSQKLAVFFPSTEQEFAIFPEFVWRNSFGGSQAEAFLAFARTAKANGYCVVVRAHPPNSKSSRQVREHFAAIEDSIWQGLCKASNAEFIESQSKVSSYDLIKKADLCATYASSISAECILLGKPTLILGESDISYCVPEICKFNESDLIAQFEEGIPIISKEALYPYGYWLECAGREPKIFKFVSDHEVYFESKLVNEYKHWVKPLLALRNMIKHSFE